MKCAECENAIFTYRELSGKEKERVDTHVATCTNCRKLFNEYVFFNQMVAKASQENVQHPSPAWLTQKIMQSVAAQRQQPKKEDLFSFRFLEISYARFALAGISACLMIMFFIEAGTAGNEQSRINRLHSDLHSVVLRSDDLRNAFTARKENKKSMLRSCLNSFNKQIDVACIKEKINKTNF